MLILALIGIISIYFEWLKIKNNHLIITENSIYVINRFKKIKEYKVDYHKTKILIRNSFNSRSGGLIIKFLDENNSCIFKYEDMLNGTSSYGFEKTKWEIEIKKLNVEIIDKQQIFKNN